MTGGEEVTAMRQVTGGDAATAMRQVTGGDAATAMRQVTGGDAATVMRQVTKGEGGDAATAMRQVTDDPGTICSTTCVAQAAPAPDTVNACASHVPSGNDADDDSVTRSMLLCLTGFKGGCPRLPTYHLLLDLRYNYTYTRTY